MSKKKITSALVYTVTGLAFSLVAVATPANAEITTTVNAGVNASTSLQLRNREKNSENKIVNIISRGDAAIADRIKSLNNLAARVQTIKNVSDSEKSSIAAEVKTNIDGLTSLKAKIDADTDVTVGMNDEKSIFGPYRIYALIIPRGHLVAAADRVKTIVGLMTTIGTKLQTRITAAQTAGKNVSVLQSSLADFNAKIADANIQAQLAQDSIVSLTPDQGDKTKLASNHAALIAARAKIKIAEQDLKAARADAKKIIDGLKAFHLKVETNISASASSSATSTTN